MNYYVKQIKFCEKAKQILSDFISSAPFRMATPVRRGISPQWEAHFTGLAASKQRPATLSQLSRDEEIMIPTPSSFTPHH